eukprot:TRINITY_DN2515_c0_g1_i3.p1 TRINITY_DN2515_c0_g1~~TRINITY_DN2515_c0_g1_i3.p1  ORF type:complete len:207 (+),score=56.15 TRINITY_DN2515_c0_g1_i3:107-727(+)
MLHQIAFRKLGRDSAHRQSMFRNMVTQLVKHERILTTLPKAKELRPVAEKMITKAKKNTDASRKEIFAYINDRDAAHKMTTELAERFKDRHGGYTRIVKAGLRDNDTAPLAFIEYLGHPKELGPRIRKSPKTYDETTTLQELGLSPNYASHKGAITQLAQDAKAKARAIRAAAAPAAPKLKPKKEQKQQQLPSTAQKTSKPTAPAT